MQDASGHEADPCPHPPGSAVIQLVLQRAASILTPKHLENSYPYLAFKADQRWVHLPALAPSDWSFKLSLHFHCVLIVAFL